MILFIIYQSHVRGDDTVLEVMVRKNGHALSCGFDQLFCDKTLSSDKVVVSFV